MLSLSFSSLKEATSHLFTLPTFDDYSLLKAVIAGPATFAIDGHTNPDFFDTDDSVPEYLPWKRLRPLCFEIIKGKRPPVSFQITLFLEREAASSFFAEPDLCLNRDIHGYTVRFHYHDHQLYLISGTMFCHFSMDRESERLFDECLLHSLKQIPITFEHS